MDGGYGRTGKGVRLGCMIGNCQGINKKISWENKKNSQSQCLGFQSNRRYSLVIFSSIRKSDLVPLATQVGTPLSLGVVGSEGRSRNRVENRQGSCNEHSNGKLFNVFSVLI